MRPWEKFTNQEQWREYLQNLVSTNDVALVRSILAIFELQTSEEQDSGTTRDHNGVGFGGVDAEFMTSLAMQIRAGRKLSPKQIAIARNKMKKYWRQLMRISKKEIHVNI